MVRCGRPRCREDGYVLDVIKVSRMEGGVLDGLVVFHLLFLRGGKMVNKLGHKIVPSENRTRRFFGEPNLLGLKRLQGFLELLLPSTAGTKVYAAGLQLLEDLLLSRG
ncbi:hypothetical protein Tco_1562710 [Tanacetum coccineum]